MKEYGQQDLQILTVIGMVTMLTLIIIQNLLVGDVIESIITEVMTHLALRELPGIHQGMEIKTLVPHPTAQEKTLLHQEVLVLEGLGLIEVEMTLWMRKIL